MKKFYSFIKFFVKPRILNNVQSRMAVVISPVSEIMFSKSRFRTAIHRRSEIDATKFSISVLSFAITS